MKLFNRLMKKPLAERALREAVVAVGGTLTFEVVSSEEGWYAECKEIDSIFTGGKSSNPTEEEVLSGIQDAMAAVFNPQEGGSTLTRMTVASVKFKLPEPVMA